MKKLNIYINLLLFVFAAVVMAGCVHDDKYSEPDTSAASCRDLSADASLKVISLADAKKLYLRNAAYEFPANSNLYLEGYVSSSDETGNIYKTIYIQDAPENPTQGFVISVDAVSTYLRYPQGSKIYVKLAGMALGEYGGVIQLGKRLGTESRATDVSRIPENLISETIFRSCSDRVKIVPKEMTLAQLGSAFDQYLGVLAVVKNAEFEKGTLCSQYAPEGQTVDRRITDLTRSSVSTRVVRNSGFASFAGKTMPAGNGDFVGILSKYNSTYQFYIVRDTDLKMNTFPRIDKIDKAPCAADASATAKTVAEVKAMLKGSLTQITGNYNLTAKVTANDETGNLYKYFYVEDATGGLRVNINMTDLYLDRRFQVGRMVTINLKDLYVANVNGEIQLGGLNGNVVGWTDAAMIYNHFFPTATPISTVVPTERTIATLKQEDVGRWVKIRDLQFIAADLGKTYADGTQVTTRTLEDCSGGKILLSTSGFADFGNQDFPMKASEMEVETGKGDVYGILSYYRGAYQLWITKLRDIDLDKPRCDGSLPEKLNATTVFKEEFNNLLNWTVVSVTGKEAWATTTFGNPAPSAIMDGKRLANQDWLISKPVALGGYTDAFLTFETDARFNGNALEVYAAETYAGSPAATTWTKLNPVLDTDLNAFAGWVNSGRVSLKAYAGKSVVIAFKYTSVDNASTTWEIDNVVVKGIK